MNNFTDKLFLFLDCFVSYRKLVRSCKIVGSIVESQSRPVRKYARSTWNAMNMNESSVRVLLKLHLWNSSTCTHPSSQPRAAFSNTYADMANRMWRYNGCGISGFTGSTEMRIGGENAYGNRCQLLPSRGNTVFQLGNTRCLSFFG